MPRLSLHRLPHPSHLHIHAHICKIRKHAINRIKNDVDNIIIYNEDSPSGPISFNIKGFEGAQAQDIGSALAAKGIAVRTGEHCAKLLLDVINTKGSVRASLYLYNSIEDMDRLVDALKEITKGDVFEWLV